MGNLTTAIPRKLRAKVQMLQLLNNNPSRILDIVHPAAKTLVDISMAQVKLISQ